MRLLCWASGLPPPASLPKSAGRAGVTLLCAVWWITEAIPIPVTALVPFAVFPLVGVLTPAQVGQAYGSPLILLYLGGFMLSTAMEKSGAHRRLALGMVSVFGGSGDRGVVFGFMAGGGVPEHVDFQHRHQSHAPAHCACDPGECPVAAP